MNIKKQLERAVHICIAYGDSKRSDKFNTEIDTGWKLYSLTYKRDMVDLARSLGKYLQAQHPSIKNAYQITNVELQAYLDSKAATCVADTLQKVLSHIGKLENCCERAYPRSRFRWHTDRLTLPVSTKNAEFVKDTPVPLDVSKTIIAAVEGKRSQVGNAFILSAYMGMRAEETTCLKAKSIVLSGGEFGYGYIRILKGPEGGAKGGRPRVIPILNQEAQDALKAIIAGKSPDNYVAAKRDGSKMTPDNVQRAMREIMDRLYGNTYKGNRNHGMRKAWAQRYFDVVRKTHSRKETVEKTNIVLGHGKDRGEGMVKMYVENIY